MCFVTINIWLCLQLFLEKRNIISFISILALLVRYLNRNLLST